MFPCMITKAATLDVICNEEGANRNGAVQLLLRCTKLQVCYIVYGFTNSTYEVASACALALGAEKLICIINGPILDEWSQF
ncbi:hypothetical protein Tco_0103558, partial [Tanacetum coccineum]